MSGHPITLDKTLCNGCGVCEKICPFGAVSMADELPSIDETCTLCGLCVKKCPRQALRMSVGKRRRDISSYRGLWIFVEHDGHRVADVSLELLSIGRELAGRCGYEVSALLIGHRCEKLLDVLKPYGASRVCLVEHPLLSRYSSDGFTAAIYRAVNIFQPSIMLFGATPLGRDLAPRVAARLGTGLTADCTELDVTSDGELIQVRPAFGGNIMARIVCRNHRPQMATVRPGVMRKQSVQSPVDAVVERVDVSLARDEIRTRLIRRIFDHSGDGSNLEEAGIIVAGGMGMGSKQGIQLLKEVAMALDGIVAGTRAVVEAGLLPHYLQVGQTGKAVSPKLYIACGISGAVQHLAGIAGAETIVSINTDPHAEIFTISNLGIVGDVYQVLPDLVTELLRLKKQGGRRPV